MPESAPAEEAGQRGKKSAMGKYKWWLIGGLAVVAVAVFYFVNKNKQQAGSQAGQPAQPARVPVYRGYNRGGGNTRVVVIRQPPGPGPGGHIGGGDNSPVTLTASTARDLSVHNSRIIPYEAA